MTKVRLKSPEAVQRKPRRDQKAERRGGVVGTRSETFSQIFGDTPAQEAVVQRKPLFQQLFATAPAARRVQPKLTVGAPDDAFEKEADQVADEVVANTARQHAAAPPTPPTDSDGAAGNSDAGSTNQDSGGDNPDSGAGDGSNGGSGDGADSGEGIGNNPSALIQRKCADCEDKEAPKVQAKAYAPEGKADFEDKLSANKGSGQPLGDAARSEMESGFEGADFGKVRVHTDGDAVKMNNRLQAKAFTHGSDIYFGQGQYDPGSTEGKRLLAHELTHTIQQGAVGEAAGPKASVQPKLGGTPNVQAGIREIINELVDALDWIGVSVDDLIDDIPGYTLFCYIVEYDIIRGRSVDQDARGLIQGLMGLVPLGNLLFEKLDEYEIIDQAIAWVEGQLSTLDLSVSRIENAISNAWDRMDLWEGLAYNVNILNQEFGSIYRDVETFAENSVDKLLELVKEALLKPLVSYLWSNSATYQLATKVLGEKFPLDDPVQAETVEILEEFLILIGKTTEVEQMQEKGTLQETADWIDTQLATFFSLLDRFGAIVDRVWDAISLESLEDVTAVFTEVFDDFLELLADFTAFAWEVAKKVLEIIKNALLAELSEHANEIPGFHLMCVIIGQNPFTGATVERTTENLIRGFMGLVPGGEAKFQELKETGVVPQAAAKIDALVERLGISLQMIIDLFTGIWNSVSIEDLIDPIGVFERIVAQFGDMIARLFEFVVEVVKVLIELILAIMNFPTELIGSVISNAMAAFEEIKADPVAFLLRLLEAVKIGFGQFFDNFLGHLGRGMQTWLFGTLADAGVTVPNDISFQSILGMSMEVLGITVDNVLDRLALKIGEDKVARIRGMLDRLEGIWLFVKDVIERGPVAIWEYVEEKLSNLWDMIVEGVKGWVMTTIIEKVVTKLLSMLDPTGIMAVVNSFIAFFKAVQSFIEKLREMLEILNTFTLGVLDIARGNTKNAADFLEQALADGIPVAISFLANQVGLGNISEKIQEMIEMARAKINEGIDWLIDKALEAGQALMQALGLGGDEEAAEAAQADNAVYAGILTVEKNFQDEEEDPHRLFFELQGNDIKIMLNEDKDTVQNHINDELSTDENDTPEQEDLLRQAQAKLQELDAYIRSQKPAEGTTPDEAKVAEVKAEVARQLEIIMDLIKRGGIESSMEPPSSVVTNGGSGPAGTVTADPLTRIAGNTTGGASTDASDDEVAGYKWATDQFHCELSERVENQDGTPGRRRRKLGWDKVHLLHENAHGPGTGWNLVAATRTVNRALLSNHEQKIIDHTGPGKESNKIFRFVITPVYYSDTELDLSAHCGIGSYYPKSFNVELKWKDKMEDAYENVPGVAASVPGVPVSEFESAGAQSTIDPEEQRQEEVEHTMSHYRRKMTTDFGNPEKNMNKSFRQWVGGGNMRTLEELLDDNQLQTLNDEFLAMRTTWKAGNRS